MHEHQLELLAPARDAAIGIAAIDHGADAVYIGGPAFGARQGAGNPLSEIARLVAHAHRYHARVFAALNTILRDDELEPARRLAFALHEAGVDGLIVQDLGLLMLDLPPLQLHASTQCDIRTPAKARFLEDVGFSQLVLARELDLDQIRAIRAATSVPLEFFVHGALCVAYSGQCWISHAHSGRSANRGECNQACRLPYVVTDSQGRVLAHDKHVLSLKDNDQGANLEALIDSGIRSFKIEGRYKDLGYVKNVTAHYRRRLDAILDGRPGLAAASSGRSSVAFVPDPGQSFNRESTDYFVRGRQAEIGAFDSPKNPGRPIGWVVRVNRDSVEIQSGSTLNNGDGLCYFDLHRELVGMAIDTALRIGPELWRVVPKDPIAGLRHLRPGTEVNRNRDRAFVRALERPSAQRRIGVRMRLSECTGGLTLSLTDSDGHGAGVSLAVPMEPARDPAQAESSLRENLAKLGTTVFEAQEIAIGLAAPRFVPASAVNTLRRLAVLQLERVRAAAFEPLQRAVPVEPPVPYPEETLGYRANCFNAKARAFYARHGVGSVAPAFESNAEPGEVALMITKHCVRWSLSLCPRQTSGVIGVQGTVKAEPLNLIEGSHRLRLVFDCKACEMHVMGRLKPGVRERQARAGGGLAVPFDPPPGKRP